MEEHEKSRESTFSFLLCEESCGHDYVRDLEMLTNLTALRENLGAEVAGLVTKKTFDSINFGGGNMPFRMWRSLFILSLLVVAPPLSRAQDNAARIKAIQANLNNANEASGATAVRKASTSSHANPPASGCNFGALGCGATR